MRITWLAVWEYQINHNNECSNYLFLVKGTHLSLKQLALAKK